MDRFIGLMPSTIRTIPGPHSNDSTRCYYKGQIVRGFTFIHIRIVNTPNRICSHEERLRDRMESEFVGGGAEQFAQGMDMYKELWSNQGNLYHGKIVPMVAPSGLGKTKVCLGYLSTVRVIMLPILIYYSNVFQHPGLYICLRPHGPSDSPAPSWPPGDKPITDFFIRHRAKVS